jgi:recombination protein RecT
MTDTMAVVAQNVNKPPIVILRERLETRRGELAAALTDITPEQFIRAVTTSATINPDIQACTWQSVWIACMQACRDGLLPDGVEGALVPFKSKASWIPMYQGLLRRFRRSGKFKWVTANVVREGEEFEHHIDEQGEHFKHVPADNFDAPIVKVYAMATTQDGGVFVTVMSIAEANKIRNMSRASRDDSPWKMWPEEMYKKTALRRLSKVLPSARDIIPDEDAPETQAMSLQDAIRDMAASPRAPGAAAALEQFAAPSTTAISPTVEDSEQQGTDDTSAAQSAAVERDPAAAADLEGEHDEPPLDDTHLLNIDAYKRGQKAKADGHARRAIPGEYREPDRTREALCWQAGYDGGTMPQFSNAES